MRNISEEMPRLPHLRIETPAHWWKRSIIIIASVSAGLLLLAPAAQAAVHTVVPGETLWNISRRYETTVDHIKSLNSLQGDLLHPGQKLTVPDKPGVQADPMQTVPGANTILATSEATTVDTEAEADSAQTAISHVVQEGDTLYGIALKYGVSIEAITNANELSDTLIHPGQTLVIQAAVTTAETPAEQAQSAASRGGTRTDNSVVEIAKAHIGTPYRYGGCGPSNFDCSGFTAYVYAQVNRKLPHNAAAQYELGQAVAKSDLQPGDLVFFGYYGSSSIQHVGIYVGGNIFIHASSGAGVVKQNSLAENYYFNNYKGARRL